MVSLSAFSKLLFLPTSSCLPLPSLCFSLIGCGLHSPAAPGLPSHLLPINSSASVQELTVMPMHWCSSFLVGCVVIPSALCYYYFPSASESLPPARSIWSPVWHILARTISLWKLFCSCHCRSSCQPACQFTSIHQASLTLLWSPTWTLAPHHIPQELVTSKLTKLLLFLSFVRNVQSQSKHVIPFFLIECPKCQINQYTHLSFSLPHFCRFPAGHCHQSFTHQGIITVSILVRSGRLTGQLATLPKVHRSLNSPLVLNLKSTVFSLTY